jgi:steroid delta-isomerase-like uncharacterized protein
LDLRAIDLVYDLPAPSQGPSRRKCLALVSDAQTLTAFVHWHNRTGEMMTESNRALAVRWFEEGWNQRRPETVDELLMPEAMGYMEGVTIKGPEEFKQVRSTLLETFPDLRLTIEDTVCDGENVVTRWFATGTHRGGGLGIPATHAPVAFRGMTWHRFANGRIAEGWDAWNQGAVVETLRAEAARLQPQ